MPSNETGIAVTCKFPILAFLMMIWRPIVEIDGTAHTGAWSRTAFPVAAGQHSVAVYWKYLWFLPCNKGTASVTVTEGATTEVTYQARWFVFSPGKVTVAAPAVPAAA